MLIKIVSYIPKIWNWNKSN